MENPPIVKNGKASISRPWLPWLLVITRGYQVGILRIQRVRVVKGLGTTGAALNSIRLFPSVNQRR